MGHSTRPSAGRGSADRRAADPRETWLPQLRADRRKEALGNRRCRATSRQRVLPCARCYLSHVDPCERLAAHSFGHRVDRGSRERDLEVLTTVLELRASSVGAGIYAVELESIDGTASHDDAKAETSELWEPFSGHSRREMDSIAAPREAERRPKKSALQKGVAHTIVLVEIGVEDSVLVGHDDVELDELRIVSHRRGDGRRVRRDDPTAAREQRDAVERSARGDELTSEVSLSGVPIDPRALGQIHVSRRLPRSEDRCDEERVPEEVGIVRLTGVPIVLEVAHEGALNGVPRLAGQHE